MNFGYVRVSSKDQNFDRQIVAFEGITLDYMFMEKQSGKDTVHRPELNKMLSMVGKGDTVYVVELSRLARSTIDLANIAKQLVDKGAYLKSLKENIDLSSSAGVLTYHILSAMAEFERACIKERQAEGIAAAKAKGAKWGAKQKYGLDKDKMDALFLTYYLDKMTRAEAVKEAKMPEATFYAQYRKWRKEQGLPSDMRRKGLGAEEDSEA